MNVIKTKPELMAPAGNWTMLNASINAGADAVYFGADKLNMRAKADNFSLEELPEIIALCKEKNVLTYLTLNTIVYESEIEELTEIISAAKKHGVDRIICWDFAVAEIAKKIEMPFCFSTQGSVSNSISANFVKSLGAARLVLARECTLKDIKQIRARTDIEIEAFVHGAMCIAVSGRCFMSHHLFGQSANRGECVQPCRREYEVYDPAIKDSLIVGEDYVLSPKDLCTIEFIDELIEAGIDSFKIEGRKRSPEYVATVVSVYRRAIDLYFSSADQNGKNLTTEKKKELLEELKAVYNRGFSAGFYHGIPSSGEYAGVEGSKAIKRKEYIGKVINYYKKNKIAYFSIESGIVQVGDELLIIGKTTGVVQFILSKILNEESEIQVAGKGERVTAPCEILVRPGDSVYVLRANVL